MKNALILHGGANNHTGNWFPWLKKELEKKGYRVWVPDLPDADRPNRKKWLNTIFSNKDWKFNNDSLLVGHSAGATLILRILENLPEGEKVNKALLVAGAINLGTMPQFFKYKRSLAKGSFDWKKIKKSCEKFYFIHSDNDPYDCGEDQGKILQEQLDGELIIKKGEGHFNLEKGSKYKKFPLILELLRFS